eukprot:NODE_1422_length_925_cov_369.367580_g1096_i1.p4 GENE.NODE_1422_length_925_cov_369.367580_g1096_i1~~NODE_1422_length_925_cov_369.367580_g1096_i1.p4  ORF type:complete len:57 (-),score=7.25 NODE_1422_length_925_cov_369.367580_g1096_i1:447-617(-)
MWILLQSCYNRKGMIKIDLPQLWACNGQQADHHQQLGTPSQTPSIQKTIQLQEPQW